MAKSEVKKCPECGTEMEKGFVVSNVIHWSSKKSKILTFGLEMIVPWQLWSIPNAAAYRCRHCKLVRFYYGRYAPDKETPEGFLKKCIACGKEIPVASEECSYCGATQ